MSDSKVVINSRDLRSVLVTGSAGAAVAFQSHINLLNPIGKTIALSLAAGRIFNQTLFKNYLSTRWNYSVFTILFSYSICHLGIGKSVSFRCKFTTSSCV